MPQTVSIIGAFHTDFAKNLQRDDREISDLVSDVIVAGAAPPQ